MKKVIVNIQDQPFQYYRSHEGNTVQVTENKMDAEHFTDQVEAEGTMQMLNSHPFEGLWLIEPLLPVGQEPTGLKYREGVEL